MVVEGHLPRALLLFGTCASCTVPSCTAFDGFVYPDPVQDGGLLEAGPADAGSGDSYRETILADAPLAYWRFGETSGIVAVDVSGNGNDGEFTGGVVLGGGGAIVGDDDRSATFDGTGVMRAGDRFPFAGKATFSLEAWIRPANVDDAYRGIFSREPTSSAAKQGYTVFVRASDGVGFDRWKDGTGDLLRNPTLSVSTWHHVVVVYEIDLMRIYVDGEGVSGPASRELVSLPGNLFIGVQHDTYFAGAIDEVAVYGTALSRDRVNAHFRVGKGLSPSL